MLKETRINSHSGKNGWAPLDLLVRSLRIVAVKYILKRLAEKHERENGAGTITR